MAIGSVIRTDTSPILHEAYLQSQRRPLIVARQAFRRPDQQSPK